MTRATAASRVGVDVQPPEPEPEGPEALVAPLALVLALMGLLGWGIRHFAQRLSRAPADLRTTPHGRLDPGRYGESPGEQYVGKTCLFCHQRIVTQREVARCLACDGPVHVRCQEEHTANAHAVARAPFR